MRLLGRFDPQQPVFPMYWTGSGLELRLRCTELDVELECDYAIQCPWLGVMVDGAPVARFPLSRGWHFYTPLALAERLGRLLELGRQPGKPRAAHLRRLRSAVREAQREGDHRVGYVQLPLCPESGLGSRAHPGRDNHRSAALTVVRRLRKALEKKAEG